jgi:uncharacterized protein DUF4157
MSFATRMRKSDPARIAGPAGPAPKPASNWPIGKIDRSGDVTPASGNTRARWALSEIGIGAPARATPTTNMSVKTGAARLDIRTEDSIGGASARAIPRRARVNEAISAPGQPLNEGVRSMMESRFAFDFSKVRVHTDANAAASAKAVNALAYTSGPHLVFGAGQFNPRFDSGRALLAHELAHFAQQGGNSGNISARTPRLDSRGEDTREAAADRAADAFTRSSVDGLSASHASFARTEPGTIQRKIAMRDVGKGEQSGFARVPELVTRLNTMSAGLTFSIDGSDLKYAVKPGGRLNNFDTQMQGFIDQAAVIPLRFTNRSGLLGDRAHGFHEGVIEDAWSSGYVDIDDLLASSDLGLQTVLVHFIRERSETKDYAKRIGSPSVDTDDPKAQTEFDAAHAKGIQSEVAVLRDFFGDPTIRHIAGAESGDVARVFRNLRGDSIITDIKHGKGKEAGVDAVSIRVVLKNGDKKTVDEYKAILAAARAAAGAAAAAAGNRAAPAAPPAARP